MTRKMTENASSVDVRKRPHHERDNLCATRPAYRQGRKLTAVKVYTVNDESQHLVVRGVPTLNLKTELKNLCMRYGEVKCVRVAADYAEDEEAFTEVYHVQYAKIQAARFAKHMIDDKEFFGGILHVCYAPELESLAETRHKLDQRTRDVLRRIKKPLPPVRKTATDLVSTESQSYSSHQNASTSAFANVGIIEQVFIPRSQNNRGRRKEMSSVGRTRNEPPSTSKTSAPATKRNYVTQFLPSSLKKARLDYKP